jgi:hypothetical protein
LNPAGCNPWTVEEIQAMDGIAIFATNGRVMDDIIAHDRRRLRCRCHFFALALPNIHGM